MLDFLVADARYGWRMLRKSPGFTAITIATLALGIGANTALFSVVDAILLRPLPYPESERLMVVMEKPPQGRMNVVSAANFLDWRDQNRVFSHLAAVRFASFNLSVKGSPDRAQGLRVSADYFGMLGVPPALGRTFTAEDDRPSAPCVTVISHGAFERRFGADRGVIGRELTMDGGKCTVIGVMPQRFRFINGPEMWAPLQLDPAKITRDFHYLFPIGRLKPGVSLEQARAQMLAIAKQIEQAYPKSNQGWSVFLEPMQSLMVENERAGALVLLGAVAFVLLIGCVNVANLLLAKAAVRQRELAVRVSLGAGRGRLMGQVLTESVLLALAGGALGVALAFWLVRLTPSVLPKSLLDGIAEIAVDWRVLLFALAVSLLTGLLFGLAPAWRASRVDLHATLKEGGRGSGGGSHTGRLRAVLVAGEVALSLALLVGAGLMVRSMLAMYSSETGLDPENVLTMRISMPEARYSTAAQVRSFDRRLLEQVRALPGVRSAGLSLHTPLQGSYFGMPFQVVGQPEKPVSERPGRPFQIVSDGFFRTFGVKLRKGRFFDERDDENAPRVAVVNETFVKEFLAKVEPIGQRLRVEELISGQRKLGPEVVWEIVGVMGNVKFGGLNGGETAEIYVPLAQSPWPGGLLAVRTALEPQRMSNAVRAAIHGLDRDMPVTDVKTMQQIAGDSVAQPRLRTWIIGVFAAAALLLAAIGIYGVMSYTVEQSTHDFGVRMALGAQPADLMRMTLRQGLILSAIGVAAGLAGSFALTRVMGSLLYGVKPTDPLTFASVALVLIGVSLLATYVPARRAAAVDPIVALRWE
jgi:predicted permease